MLPSDMNETQLATFFVALVASFVWVQLKRGTGRLTRALGVVAIMGASVH